MSDEQRKRGVYPRELENGMTAAEVEQLQACPDCYGRGNISTPATNWNRKVTCANCHGSGLVKRMESDYA